MYGLLNKLFNCSFSRDYYDESPYAHSSSNKHYHPSSNSRERPSPDLYDHNSHYNNDYDGYHSSPSYHNGDRYSSEKTAPQHRASSSALPSHNSRNRDSYNREPIHTIPIRNSKITEDAYDKYNTEPHPHHHHHPHHHSDEKKGRDDPAPINSLDNVEEPSQKDQVPKEYDDYIDSDFINDAFFKDYIDDLKPVNKKVASRREEKRHEPDRSRTYPEETNQPKVYYQSDNQEQEPSIAFDDEFPDYDYSPSDIVVVTATKHSQDPEIKNLHRTKER